MNTADLPVDAPAAHASTWRAPAFAAGLALALITAIVLVTGALQSLHRPLWLDEIVTQLVANAPRGIVHAMRSGVDFQPPPHYALVRLADLIAGGATPAATRAPSLIAAALTVLFLAATLRTTLSLAAALAGVLALAAHPLFLAQAFEARPYALWILATALTAEALRDRARTRPWLAAAAAVALCTTHYFGILSLVAIGAAAVLYTRLARRHSWSATTRTIAPLAAGGVGLLALLPLASAQLAATNGRSWVSPATAGDIGSFLSFPWGWRPALLLMTAGALLLIARRVPALAVRLPQAPRVALGLPGFALLATAFVPVLVVLVTLLVKPVLVLRYSAPAVLAVATVCALAVELFPPALRWAAVLLLARAAVFSAQSTATAAHNETVFLAGEVRTVRALAAQGIPTVSPFRHDAYRASLLLAGAPGTGAASIPDSPGVAWIDLPDSLLARVAATPSAGLSRELLLVERDFGRAVHREFGFPAVRSAEQVRAVTTVALLRDATHAGADTLWLPGWQPCALSGRLVLFTAPASPRPCGALRAAVQDAPSRR